MAMGSDNQGERAEQQMRYAGRQETIEYSRKMP